MDIQITETDSADADIIEAQLLRSLQSTLTQALNEQFALRATSDTGQMIGGLTASTSYGWLLIKTLWVDQQFRKQGIGQKLMSEAEDRGRSLQCHSAWLDTSNPASQRFYHALGYSNFGHLKNATEHYPPEHQRWFMKKSL